MKRGDKVIIPKGTIIFSTYSGWPDLGRAAGRTYRVEPYRSHLEEVTSDGAEIWSVHWAGTGGYWKWAYLHDPTIVSPLEQLAQVQPKKEKG